MLAGGGELQTTNARQAYQYWASEPPPANGTVVRGQYCQSGPFSNEHIVWPEVVALPE